MKGSAEESKSTKRARRKLEQQISAFDKKITSEALERKLFEIKDWIAKNSHHRVALRSKSISLFDENQNAASISARVKQISEKLKKQMETGDKWKM